MAQKRLKAARANGTAFEMQPMPTACTSKDSASHDFRQAPIGAIRLARRFGLSVATAAAVAEANRWGRA